MSSKPFYVYGAKLIPHIRVILRQFICSDIVVHIPFLSEEDGRENDLLAETKAAIRDD
eukprot:gene1626-4762_t